MAIAYLLPIRLRHGVHNSIKDCQQVISTVYRLHQLSSFLLGNILFLETETFNCDHDFHKDCTKIELNGTGVYVEPFDLIALYEGADMVNQNQYTAEKLSWCKSDDLILYISHDIIGSLP